MSREYFFRQGHRTVAGCYRWNSSFALEPRDVEREQPAVLNYLPGYFVFASRELFERNFVAARDAADQIEVSRSEQPEILAILFVDAFDVLRNCEPDARRKLG